MTWYRTLIFVTTIVCMTPLFAAAQDFGQLDPKPYDPAVDSDIDLYLTNWRESMPRHYHGSLILRDVFTRGDHLEPPRRGAVLEHLNAYSHATLEAGATTTPVALDGEQEVYYTLSGVGRVETDGKTADLYKGIAVLVPMGLEFTITNTGDEPMIFYLVNEPVPEGFEPLTEIKVRDENTAPYETSTVHWCMVFKRIFDGGSGLATIQSIITVTFAPLTMGQPHSHDNGCEETWLALEGDNSVLLGKQLRRMPPGTAYMIPPDGNTPHAQINTSNDPIKLFHVARYSD